MKLNERGKIMNLNKIIKKGGATLSIKTLKSVDYSDGYMVGVAGILRDVKNINHRQRVEIKKEILAMAQSFKTSSKNYHIGLWVNKGKLYIDLSLKIDNLMDAMEVGYNANQKAIWDNAKKVEIPLDFTK